MFLVVQGPTVVSGFQLGFGTLIMGLTLFRYKNNPLGTGLGLSDKRSFSGFIFRSGVFYFVLVFILDALVVAFNSEREMSSNLREILTSRFLLDLREAHERPNGTIDQAETLTTFHASAGRIRSAIVDDFGDHTSIVSQNVDEEIAAHSRVYVRAKAGNKEPTTERSQTPNVQPQGINNDDLS
ncbi:hypothetical protein K439DRAFT_1660453 [Ramaria rubella]|nr:hypothetical protein K439DRAFT_1660453 [Ramaria rubella]